MSLRALLMSLLEIIRIDESNFKSRKMSVKTAMKMKKTTKTRRRRTRTPLTKAA